MRDYLLLYVNGAPVEIRGAEAFRTLTGYVRTERHLTGTKVVCEEGDCGACTVLIGRVEEGAMVYRPVNACILHLYQLDRAHVVTVEGLARDGSLSAVQASMVHHHGAQCGFCTPGFVTAMTALYEAQAPITEQAVRDGLTGNLCRCTGYEPILKAALAVDPAGVPRLNDLYPPEAMRAAFEAVAQEPVHIDAGTQIFCSPITVEEAARFKAAHPGVVIVQGGTDVGVWCNKRGYVPDVVLGLSQIPGMDEIAVRGGRLDVGGTATLQALEAFVRDLVPAFHGILRLFGSPQIRHAGTLAGNIGNGSPIADSLPFLYVMEAELELAGVNGHRRVGLREFFRGYKTFDLAPDEMIARIRIPLPEPDETLRLYKVSKRKDLDISTFTAAFRMMERDGRIERIHIAYGGVGPVVMRLPQTEAFLAGQAVTLETFVQAGQLAREEIAPISDVRGSRDFRLQLAETVMLKFYHELAGAEVVA
ncbi:MAG TPA: FAD binding domain-containing protein [Rhodothermales bacterium]|nr:FAD binding domain-containing protein [Rhodothermales bacterium]